MIKAKYTFISAGRAEGVKCERCWKIGDFNPHARLCPRCLDQHVEWATANGNMSAAHQAVRDKTSLAGRNLLGVIFYKWDLSGMDFSGARMPTDCQGANFTGCNLSGTKFDLALTDGAIFDNGAWQAVMRQDQQALLPKQRSI
jgi:uncharacterized protein YjbI with pentapeptide repeats